MQKRSIVVVNRVDVSLSIMTPKFKNIALTYIYFMNKTERRPQKLFKHHFKMKCTLKIITPIMMKEAFDRNVTPLTPVLKENS